MGLLKARVEDARQLREDLQREHQSLIDAKAQSLSAYRTIRQELLMRGWVPTEETELPARIKEDADIP